MQEDVCGLYAKYYTILCKGLERLQAGVYGVPETKPPQKLRDNYSFYFQSSLIKKIKSTSFFLIWYNWVPPHYM